MSFFSDSKQTHIYAKTMSHSYLKAQIQEVLGSCKRVALLMPLENERLSWTSPLPSLSAVERCYMMLQAGLVRGYGCQSCSWSAEQGKRNFPCPRSRLRVWSRELGSAVPSRVYLLILHIQAESGAYLRDSTSLCYGFHWNRHAPSG